MKRTWGDANVSGILDQIIFSGYGRSARWIAYDEEYGQITPMPEPTTYGAILGTLGIGLVAWEKRRQQPNKTKTLNWLLR